MQFFKLFFVVLHPLLLMSIWMLVGERSCVYGSNLKAHWACQECDMYAAVQAYSSAVMQHAVLDTAQES